MESPAKCQFSGKWHTDGQLDLENIWKQSIGWYSWEPPSSWSYKIYEWNPFTFKAVKAQKPRCVDFYKGDRMTEKQRGRHLENNPLQGTPNMQYCTKYEWNPLIFSGVIAPKQGCVDFHKSDKVRDKWTERHLKSNPIEGTPKMHHCTKCWGNPLIFRGVITRKPRCVDYHKSDRVTDKWKERHPENNAAQGNPKVHRCTKYEWNPLVFRAVITQKTRCLDFHNI